MSGGRAIFKVNMVDLVSKAIKVRNYINSITKFKKDKCIQADEALKILDVVLNGISYSIYTVTKSKSFEGTYMFIQEVWIRFQDPKSKGSSDVSIVMGFPRSCMEYMEIDLGDESPRIKVI